MKRKLGLVGLCLLLIFSLAGCGKPASQVAFEKAMNQMEKVYDENQNLTQGEKVVATVIKKATYKIKKVEENGEKSQISITVKAVNVPAYIGEYMSKMMPLAFSGATPEIIDATGLKFFEDLVKREDLSYVEKDGIVFLEKRDDKWAVTNSNEVFSLLIGGVDKAFNEQQVNGNDVNLNDDSVVEADDGVPAEFKAALNSANSYANNMGMSKKAVHDQLISEYGGGFEEDAVKYAMENIEANWKENALKEAISYQKTMNMSRKAIYKQLISEYGGKYTKEEADYALENLPK